MILVRLNAICLNTLRVITKLRAIDDLPTGVITKLDEILNFGIVAKLESPTMRMCFVAGTLVHTDHGLVPIEEIQVGDMVLSRNPETFEQGYKPVVNLFTTLPTQVIRLNIEGASGLEMIETTPEHPFYVENQAEFVSAGELDGTSLLATSVQGGTAFITDIESQRGPPSGTASWTTYNFEVADWHTYFVGKNGFWVHNSSEVSCETIFSFINWKITEGIDEVVSYQKLVQEFPSAKGPQLGAVVEDLVRSRNPNANIDADYIFTKERYGASEYVSDHDRHLNNLIAHWKKRQERMQLLHLNNPIVYAERAIELANKTQVDDPAIYFVLWQKRSDPSVGGTWNKVVIHRHTNEIAVKSVSGPDSGRIRTLHERSDAYTEYQDKLWKWENVPGSPEFTTVKPEGVIE